MSHSSHSSHSSTPTHANVGTMPLNSLNETNAHYNSAYVYDGAASPMSLSWGYWDNDATPAYINQSTDALYELFEKMKYVDEKKGVADTFVQVSTTTPEGSYFTYPTYDSWTSLAATANTIKNGPGVEFLASYINNYTSNLQAMMAVKNLTSNVYVKPANKVVGEFIENDNLVSAKIFLDDVAEYDYSAEHMNHANHQNHASHSSYNG